MTEEEKARAKELRAQGCRIGTIARLMNKHDGNLRKWFERQSRPNPQRQYTDQEILDALRMKDEGKAHSEIAAHMRTTRNAVSGLMHRIKQEEKAAEGGMQP